MRDKAGFRCGKYQCLHTAFGYSSKYDINLAVSLSEQKGNYRITTRGCYSSSMSACFSRNSERDQLAIDIAAGMLAADGFDGHRNVVHETLIGLGATAVNIAAVRKRDARVAWFHSTLPDETLQSYIADGHGNRDFIVRHVGASPSPFVWDTASAIMHEENTEGATFAAFVRDSGTGFILSQSHDVGWAPIRVCITFCSDLTKRNVAGKDGFDRLQTALRLMVPWIGAPNRTDGPGWLPAAGPILSAREVEALTLLAGGLLNARIADAMGITEATVAKHLRSARVKLGSATREEALSTAIQECHLRELG